LPMWNLLVGFPGEGADVYQKYLDDLPLLTHLSPPSGAYPVRFDRYSPYFMKSKEYGLDLHPLDYYSLIYPFSGEQLANMAYYFADFNLGAEYAQTVLQWIGKIREKVSFWIDLWKSDGNHPELLLYKDGDQNMIKDSRSGELKEYPIGEVSARILNLLSDTKRMGDVANEFRDVEGFDAAKEIADLREKGLIFHEDNRFISLVLTRNGHDSI
ncbi:MAG TPA: hypothetical protein VF435_01705, partial [Pyrinomonadaceae bacterium]